MSLRFEVVLTVEVDESANFLEVIEDSTLEVVKEKISDALYDVDDLVVNDIDLIRRLE